MNLNPMKVLVKINIFAEFYWLMNLNPIKEYVRINIVCGILLAFQNNNRLEFNQYVKLETR